MVTREGGARIRPGLRSVLEDGYWLDQDLAAQMVGGFEHFFLNDGRKALLFAVRLQSGVVGFKVAVYSQALQRFEVKNLTSAGVEFSIPQGENTLNFSTATTFVKYLQIDNKIFALSDGGEDLRLFNVGNEKSARKVTPITVPAWDTASTLTIRHPDAAWINNPVKNTIPASETSTTPTPPENGTLYSGTPARNTFSYGYFYTFENEIGESAASQLKIVQAQRPWSQWYFFAPDSSGNKTTTAVTDPAMAMDQLVAILPESVFLQALLEGAVCWNLYMFTWSSQDAVPSEAILIGSRDLTDSPTYQSHGWIANTAAIDLSTSTAMLPTESNRYNYSDPSSAAQGLVAGDRLVLVNDRQNGAVIRWSSNQVGEYTNFSPTKGGGYKTLTSGNLLIPVSVKLWQNPQSVDTITILCSGVDGYSTSYYMAPASVSGQSQETLIMGFEETTATPGTVSPYGVEVLNNALYHPLDTELMKSTASNYNINHATMSDDIADKWTQLLNKQNIISSQHDNRLYYLVHNPEGEPLQAGCKGNEIWVYDTAKETGTWSRWLVQGIALSKLELNGQLYVSLARPEGIFVFDTKLALDEKSSSEGTVRTAIPWKLETNTQGANRAHDAWAHVQQANVILANFRGTLRYGVRARDVHGQLLDLNKVATLPSDIDATGKVATSATLFDNRDFLAIRRDLQEWFFYAESVTENAEVLPSYGQLSLVEYRFTPVSVNVGYEYGSTESYEYRLGLLDSATNTFNGVPDPFADRDRM